MNNRDEFLVFARRIHNLFRGAIAEGDGSNNWAQNRQRITHHMCGIYLGGCLSHLEGKYGTKCWHNPGAYSNDFDRFVQNHPKLRVRTAGVSKAGLDALVCIRNAYTHNENDLSKNSDPNSLSKVTNSQLPGVTLNGAFVELISNNTVDFTSYVRLSLVVVAQYYGDG